MWFGCVSVPGTAALTASTCCVKEFPEKTKCAGVLWMWPSPLALSFHWYDLPGYFGGECRIGSILHSWCITLQFWSASRRSTYSRCSVACKTTRSVSPVPGIDHKQDFNEREGKKGKICIPQRAQPSEPAPPWHGAGVMGGCGAARPAKVQEVPGAKFLLRMRLNPAHGHLCLCCSWCWC